MNGDYDLKAAGNDHITSVNCKALWLTQHNLLADQLEYLSGERSVSAVSGIQLSRFTNVSDWPNAYRVLHMKSAKQLVYAEGTRKDPETTMSDLVEVVVHVQGIIWRHDLPPFRNQEITAKKARYLRQSVSLTGLGTPTFEAAVKGILDVYSLFGGHVPRDKLKPCGCIDAYGEFTSIDSSNRYFSSIKDCGPTERQIPFSSDTDPYGILSNLENSGYVHNINNVVEYYERTILETGETKYVEISPVRFQIGDIVEAQMTFMLVSLPGNDYKMVSILRSMTMLDNSFSQKAFASKAASKLHQNLKTQGKHCVVKRKIGYGDEERASIRVKLGQMIIDDDNSENQRNDRASEEGEE
ncbi:hypothetical protein F5887DRAFT_1081409 [Amanita rubescens]|nr:hypothetical protein F5887DRAFT_1082623 [Amanita rubescens]KAF8330970.1 hypothetical protein F5887DRAFT_1081409 [Amanita rubescens]